MKKKLFSILLSLAVVVTMIPAAGSVAFAADDIVIANAFPDANLQTAIASRYDTIVKDGKLSEEECAQATELFLGTGLEGDIADLTGLEKLTSLEKITIDGSSIGISAKSLNVSTMPGLQQLIVENTQVSNIDVSKNAGLNMLVIVNSPVDSLDVSKNTGMEMLQVVNTPVSELDISNNKNLTGLAVVGSNVTSLDISALDTEKIQNINITDNKAEVELYIGCTKKVFYETNLINPNLSTGTVSNKFLFDGSMKIKHQEVTTKGKAATCTATGLTDGIKCSACNTVIQEQKTIAKKAHTPVAVAGKAATCTATGLTEGSKCSVCDTVIKKQETIAAAGHKYSTAWTVDKKATMSEAGSKSHHCTVCGAKKSVTAISKAATVKLAAKTKVYTGKLLKPAVTVKDAKGNVIAESNYTVKYADNKKVGEATATVTFKNKYKGTKKLTFKIKPKKAAVKSAIVGKKKITVKAGTKVAATGGTKYKIAYKVKGASKWKYTTTTNQSKVIKKLKKGKKYQVKIRAIKGDYVGAWSAVKTTKKVK